MDNCTSVVGNLLTKLKIDHTTNFVEDSTISHPDYPSLLAVSDTLAKYRIENLPVKVDGPKLQELPLPCIVQLSDHGGMFHVLTHHSTHQSTYLDDKGKKVTVPYEEFMSRWTGICLLAEATSDSGEPGIAEKLAERKAMTIFTWAGAFFLLLWAVFSFSNSQLAPEMNPFLVGGYTLLKVLGLAVGTMLLWYEVDKYNPTLQNFCSGGKKVNCDSVLNSKYAKIRNGNLSLGLIGFSYFFGTLALLFVSGFQSASLGPLAYLSFAALPMVVLSAYYQGVVIKQWCRFCMIVQAVLLLEASIAFLGGFHLIELDPTSIPLLIALFIMPIPIWNWLKPLLEKEKEANLYKRGLQKIKNNPDVFLGLLQKSRKIKTSIEGLGITFKNDTARHDVVKVCNPYCGPCAKAHPLLDELLRDGKINLQVLFTASTDEGDRRNRPVKHFLALDEMDKELAHKAMDSWYLAKDKDYEQFAKAYELNGELLRQDHKVLAMNEWCKAEKITHTPTIFINGYELPKEYSVDDLRGILG
ncbi:vitamin K epoxide reductase family protein [Allomuricauda taeanensis]|uniref:vitamin K epoxide reductase family protein n=1 Tax=Flagellimonas taeanensis TaxID=1005926 RepID=UPI002E7C006A|nr:vitamin K epoxide reductase family protein [Allomuricauda taeanensis]MEE1963463.1 vitamin K epoxide reductase family protein [Allomuricauda taeanensis]